MDYRQALDFMFGQLPMFQRIGPAAYKADLLRTLALCDKLGNPQELYPGIHIAGTNGKGSVASFLAAALQTAGYRTGLFTSPHLADYRERIRVNGEKVSEDFVAAFVTLVKDDLLDLSPSFFEMSYALAAEWFREQDVDIVVWETGMGGRLDSTNVITPILSVITNIGLDHTQFLGDSIGQIASEKAGIIKTGVPVVIGQRHPESDPVFLGRAQETGSEIIFAGDVLHVGIRESDPLGGRLVLDVSTTDGPWLEGLVSGLPGSYQRHNVLTALMALKLLGRSGFQVPDERIRHAFMNVRSLSGIAGRWLRLSEHPTVICDTGHNVDGIREVVAMLHGIRYNRLYFVLGMVDDKDVDPVLRLLPADAHYLFCQAGVPRAMEAGKLAAKAGGLGLRGEIVTSCVEALDKARQLAASDDLVFVGGSTFVVAEVLGH